MSDAPKTDLSVLLSSLHEVLLFLPSSSKHVTLEYSTVREVIAHLAWLRKREEELQQEVASWIEGDDRRKQRIADWIDEHPYGEARVDAVNEAAEQTLREEASNELRRENERLRKILHLQVRPQRFQPVENPTAPYPPIEEKTAKPAADQGWEVQWILVEGTGRTGEIAPYGPGWQPFAVLPSPGDDLHPHRVQLWYRGWRPRSGTSS